MKINGVVMKREMLGGPLSAGPAIPKRKTSECSKCGKRYDPRRVLRLKCPKLPDCPLLPEAVAALRARDAKLGTAKPAKEPRR